MSNFNFIRVVRRRLPLDINPPDIIILLLPNSVWLKALASCRPHKHTNTQMHTRTHIQYDCEDAFELPSAFYPINCIKEKGLSLKTVIPVYRDSTHTHTLPFSTKLIPSRTESTLYLYAHSFLFVPVFTFLRFVITVFKPINNTVKFINQF